MTVVRLRDNLVALQLLHEPTNIAYNTSQDPLPSPHYRTPITAQCLLCNDFAAYGILTLVATLYLTSSGPNLHHRVFRTAPPLSNPLIHSPIYTITKQQDLLSWYLLNGSCYASFQSCFPARKNHLPMLDLRFSLQAKT